MSKDDTKQKGIKTFILASIILSIVIVYSIITDIWFLIALPVGFLFGFFLQKGDLCGSSAFSEVLLLKDKSKVFGLWIAILVSMVGITILDLLGLVAGSWSSARLSNTCKLLPKPLEQTVVAFFGGILVGTGAAIATGCVIGNIISGWALMSVGLVIFGIVAILMNWLTTYIYLMGGTFLRSTK